MRLLFSSKWYIKYMVVVVKKVPAGQIDQGTGVSFCFSRTG